MMRKTLSLIISLLVLLTNGVFAYSAETNFWKSRRTPVQLASASPFSLPLPSITAPSARALPASLTSSFRGAPVAPELRSAYAALPRDAGTVRKILIPAHPNGQVVVYVQDVHGNVEAQKNIAAALTALEAKVSVGSLALEGTAGPLGLEAFREFPAGAAKTAIGLRMVEKGLMSGAALAAWNAPTDRTAVVGIDDHALHQANVGAYLQARVRRDALRSRLAATERALAARKRSAFHSDLAAFDAIVEAHRAGTAPLSDYARAIDQRRSTVGGEIGKFLLAFRLERSLDFDQVERERATLLQRLIAKMTDARTQALLELGLAYRSGQISAGEFNGALSRMCGEAGVPLTDYPAMKRYLDYVRISDDIDVEKLSADLNSEEAAIFARLATSTEQKRLVQESKALFLVGGLLDFSLSREDWNEAKLLLSRGDSGLDVSWSSALTPFEDFYRYAELRDRALTDHLLAEMNRRGLTVAAVVTGGFHSTGVEQRLLSAGVSVLRFTPKVTRVESHSTLTALSAFAQEKTPLEKIFDGRSLFLSPDPFPLEARRESALGLSAVRALIDGASLPTILGWIQRAVPVWRSLKAAVAAGHWLVSGTETREDGADVPFSMDVDRDGNIQPLSLSAKTFWSRLGARLFHRGLARPLLETVGLLAVHAGFLFAFPGSATLAPLVVGSLFAAVHPSVYVDEDGHRRSASDALLHFLFLASLGAVFVGLLSQPLGFGKAFGAHALYNGAILTAKAIARNGHRLPNPFAPEALLAAANGTLVPFQPFLGLPRTSLFGRLITAVASLPLAMVARSAPERETTHYLMKRTNGVEEIVMAPVFKIDGDDVVSLVRPTKTISADEVEAELRKPAAKQIELSRAALATDPVDVKGAQSATAMSEFLLRWGADVEGEIRSRLLPASRAVRVVALQRMKEHTTVVNQAKEVLKKKIADQQGEKKDEDKEEEARIKKMDADERAILMSAFKLSAALESPLLKPEQIEDEMRRPSLKQLELGEEAMYKEPMDMRMSQLAQVMGMFMFTPGRMAEDLIREGVPAPMALEDAADIGMVTNPMAAVDPRVREMYRSGLKLANYLVMDEKTVEPVDPLRDVAGEVDVLVRNPDEDQMAGLVYDPLQRVKTIIVDGDVPEMHWVTLAQSEGIIVMGSPEREASAISAWDSVETGDTAIADGIHHEVTFNPTKSGISTTEREIEEQAAISHVRREWAQRPSQTADGLNVPMSSVMFGFPEGGEETKVISEINRAAGGNVGLFRTEYLYAKSMPDEDQLIKDFTSLARGLNGELSVRAIDRRSGDKKTVFDNMEDSDKNELHWLLDTTPGQNALRSLIKTLLIARSQLERKNIKFFVPMVESAEQVKRVLKIIDEVKAELREKSLVPTDDDMAMPFGIMIEKRLFAPKEEDVKEQDRQDTERLEAILSVPGVSFVSIGTRDLFADMQVTDVTNQKYLDQIRKIVTMSVAHGKTVSFCGEHTSNVSLIAFVNSLDIPNDRLPGWSVVQYNIPRIKSAIAAMDRRALRAGIAGRSSATKIAKYVAAIQRAARRKVTESADFEVAFNQVLVQKGVTEAVRRDFDQTTYRYLRGVTAYAPGGRVPAAKASKTGYDFSLINALGRHAVSILQFVGTNGNRALLYMARLAQSRVDRVVFSKDSRNRWKIIGAEGHRPGKSSHGALPVGSHLGFGSQPREMLLLSMETPSGLYSGNNAGLVLGRVYGDEGTLINLPDAYMFKIATARSLADLPLSDLLAAAQNAGADGVNLDKIAREIVNRAETILGRKPKIAVLLRDRQAPLIEALATALGVGETYATIKTRVTSSPNPSEEFHSSKPDGGTLQVYGYDDWTASLSFADNDGLDLFVGIGGTPEALMTAAIAKKLNGNFSGTLVPVDNQRYTDEEREILTRSGIKEAKKVYGLNEMVPGNADDIAIGVSVLGDFTGPDGKTISGPQVREPVIDKSARKGHAATSLGGQVEATVLWVASADADHPRGQVIPVRLVYATMLTNALQRLRTTPKSVDAALDVALGWLEFGRYDRAKAVAGDWLPKADAGSAVRKKWLAIAATAEAGLHLTTIKHASDEEAVRAAIENYEKAIDVLRDSGEADFQDELQLDKRIRRLYYWLRDIALRQAFETTKADERERLVQQSIDAAGKAFAYTERGLETRRRQNNIQLLSIRRAYDAWDAAHWANPGNTHPPTLTEKVAAVFDIVSKFRDEPGFKTYAEILGNRGAEIWNAILFATVLREDPLDDQARILSFLHRNAEARALAARIRGEAVTDRDDFIANAVRFIEAGRARQSWQSRVLARIPGERQVVRPEIRQLLPRFSTRPEASAVLTELVLASLAKSAIMTALGNADRSVEYLEEAAPFANFIQQNPQLLGSDPVPVIFELAILYQGLLAQTGDSDTYSEMARFFSHLTTDGDAFKAYLQGLEADGQRLYPDNRQIDAWNTERAGYQQAMSTRSTAETPAPTAASAAPEATDDNSGTPPIVNSLPYYVALIWNRLATPRWQIANSERWIARGYALEISVGLTAILLAVLLPGASHPAFFVGATPVTALAAAVFGIVTAYAALHAAAWAGLMLLDGRFPIKPVAARFGLHAVGFLPYVLFAQAVALNPGLSAGTVLLAIVVALWHIGFDETLARSAEDLTLTPAQQARYDALLAALHARKVADGSLSRQVDSILPLAADQGVTPAGFAHALDLELRRAAKARPASLDQAVDAALRAAGDGPILVFVTADGPPGEALAKEAFAKARANGRNRPVLVAIDPDVPNADAVAADIARVQEANSTIPSSVRRLGTDVTLRGGAYHYEDLFAAFASDVRLTGEARAMLDGLASGRVATGERIVQINASAQKFVGRADLVALILLVLPDVRGNGVLLDLKAVMLVAQQA